MNARPLLLFDGTYIVLPNGVPTNAARPLDFSGFPHCSMGAFTIPSSSELDRYLRRRLFKQIFLNLLILFMTEQYLVPIIKNSIEPLTQMHWGHLLERLLKLSVRYKLTFFSKSALRLLLTLRHILGRFPIYISGCSSFIVSSTAGSTCWLRLSVLVIVNSIK